MSFDIDRAWTFDRSIDEVLDHTSNPIITTRKSAERIFVITGIDSSLTIDRSQLFEAIPMNQSMN